MSAKHVTKILDASIQAFDKITDILENEPNMAGILNVHDKCLDLKKVYTKKKEKIGGRS